MANPSYNIKDVYKAINTINNYFSENNEGGLVVQRENKIINAYCHYGNTSGKCHDYYQRASSGVIYFIKMLKEKSGLEYDKLAEYAILWLGYKLAMKAQNNGIKLNNFYTNYIEKNKYYNEKIKDNDSMTYKDIIDKKKDLMDIKEISKFDYPFSILFYLYNVNKPNDVKCTNGSNYPENFANEFKELSNDSNNIENSSYNKMLSTLSDDYNNLKEIYVNNKSCNFPPLPQIEPKKSSAQNIVDNSVVNPGKGSGQTLGETLEVTSSSSSILSTLIPGLSVVSVIPAFLGIAYKYSLFGVDKLFQRQYLRKKLKKVKKKMKLNI
ncbi:CIR protein PIR protein [Plasmodium vinckei lentum]|uniref:CIR protein PIR protein n=1 Tax=Plasmodium vinckei lentum TaxID=138297 RepID=A0A6V7RUL6_PLAVN|nr:CIR protein PIR protein [Plasmodium vinckei lentum]